MRHYLLQVRESEVCWCWLRTQLCNYCSVTFIVYHIAYLSQQVFSAQKKGVESLQTGFGRVWWSFIHQFLIFMEKKVVNFYANTLKANDA